MKDLCFLTGVAIGLTLGAILSYKCDNVKELVQKGESTLKKKMADK